jgi:ferredoxin
VARLDRGRATLDHQPDALRHGAIERTTLLEPLIVIVAIYTLISLILIGRGVFCGWLCPFGALQELLAQVSRALRLPQWTPSASVESRLRWGKYIAGAALLVLAFVAIGTAESAAEIEPFKTAITAKFSRGWPYVLYAGALLSVGLFTERAYCRFLCPLGGVLAALDRFHLLDRLRRRAECGSPCRLCEAACPVRAIEKVRKDRDGRVLPVPRLPGRVFRRRALPAAGRGAAARRTQRQGGGPCVASRAAAPFRIVAAAAGLPLLIAGVRAAQPKPRFFSWQGEVLGAASELTLWHSDESARAPLDPESAARDRALRKHLQPLSRQ